MLKDKNVSALDEENAKFSKRLSKTKGVYNIKKWVKIRNFFFFKKLFKKNKNV